MPHCPARRAVFSAKRPDSLHVVGGLPYLDVLALQTRSTPHLWNGMVLEAKGDLRAAEKSYGRAASLAAEYDWQGSYRRWKALSALGETTAAAQEEQALKQRWGEMQFRW